MTGDKLRVILPNRAFKRPLLEIEAAEGGAGSTMPLKPCNQEDRAYPHRVGATSSPELEGTERWKIKENSGYRRQRKNDAFKQRKVPSGSTHWDSHDSDRATHEGLQSGNCANSAKRREKLLEKKHPFRKEERQHNRERK